MNTTSKTDSGQRSGVPAQASPMQARLDQLALARRQAVEGDGPDAQHRRGKLTVRERIELLLDPGTFHEMETFRRHRCYNFGIDAHRPFTDGVVAGWGHVHDRRVFLYAHDFRIFGGTLGEAHSEKIHKVMDLAIKTGCPLVGINDGGGARIQEGVPALAGFGGIFQRHVAASGVIPQISIIVGPCAGGAAYSPALTDFVFAVRDTSQMFVTGPSVVEAVTGERVGIEALGGANVQAKSGVVHGVYNDERECFEDVRYLLSLLPQNRREPPPIIPPEDDACRPLKILDIVPAETSRAYDMRDVIHDLVDDGEAFEIHAEFARNIVCALARLGGMPVGIVGNQPSVLAGALDIDASQKAARFVAFCDAFQVPILTLVDVPGFLPGLHQEHQGIIRHGAKLLYAYCNATVPRIQVILRKAYGGAYIVMDSRSIGADLSFAWPGNEVAVMGAEAAAELVFRKNLATAGDQSEARADLLQHYRSTVMSPFFAAERGLVDDIIDPRDTRRILIEAFDVLRTKELATVPARRHGNPPQ